MLGGAPAHALCTRARPARPLPFPLSAALPPPFLPPPYPAARARAPPGHVVSPRVLNPRPPPNTAARAPQNELGILEFIHAFVETLDRYFENVCELDIMFNIEKAHFILDEMVTNGVIVETNKANVLKPVLLLEKVSK
jgi:hypothetical protein